MSLALVTSIMVSLTSPSKIDNFPAYEGWFFVFGKYAKI